MKALSLSGREIAFSLSNQPGVTYGLFPGKGRRGDIKKSGAGEGRRRSG